MKYEVGDIVLMLHSKEEGEIVEIMGENMVKVNVGGIEFPVFIDQIDFPYYHRFRQKSKAEKENPQPQKVYIDQIPKEKPYDKTIKPEKGVHLSMVPVYEKISSDDNIGHFKLYLVNQNNDEYHFNYMVRYKEYPDFVIDNTIRPQQDFYLHNISIEEFNDIIRFNFKLTLVPADKKKEDHVEKSLKIKAKLLFSKIEEMKSGNFPSLSFDIINKYPLKPPEDYFLTPAPVLPVFAKKRNTKLPVTVVDLHIEKLMENHTGMSNFEILQVQLGEFEKVYLEAVNNKLPKLTVIHGIGSGKLRDEIHALLRSKKEVKSFILQYHPAYGFGATEVYFQY